MRNILRTSISLIFLSGCAAGGYNDYGASPNYGYNPSSTYTYQAPQFPVYHAPQSFNCTSNSMGSFVSTNCYSGSVVDNDSTVRVFQNQRVW